MSITLSAPEARRLAIASQGFGIRPAKPAIAHLRRLAARLYAFQLDSVNVFARAHYVPAFARLGPYPLVRYRMHRHTERTQEYMRSSRGAYMAEVYAEVAERGPISAADLSNPGKRTGSWWGWWGSGNGKATLEHLYDSGLVAIAGRRGFERLYDLTERIIPRAAIDAPVPPREEAMKRLICLAAKAYGVGTFGDITGYFNIDGWRDRLPPGPWWARPKGQAGRRATPIAKRLIAEV